jgi:hypothetical protein
MISLTSPDDYDKINNDFIVAVTYPVVATGDLVVNYIRYHERWRIFIGWTSFRIAFLNLSDQFVVEPDYWSEWLSKAFGYSLEQQYKEGAEQMSIEIIAYPYLGYASLQVIQLALAVFSFCLLVMRQIHPKDTKRSGTLLIVCWFMSITLWHQLLWTGRDFTHEGKQHYLYGIFSRHSWVIVSNFNDDGFHYHKYPVSFFSILIILVLLVSYFKLLPRRRYDLPPPAIAAVSRLLKKLRDLVVLALNPGDRPLFISIPVVVLVIAHVIMIIVLRIVMVPIGTPISRTGNTFNAYYFSLPTGISSLFPLTTYRIPDLDQALAIFAGSAAAFLSLLDVLKQRDVYSIVSVFRRQPQSRHQANMSKSATPGSGSSRAIELGHIQPAKLRKSKPQSIAQNF